MKPIEEYVRSIPDFPESGIIFRDVTSILQDADGLHLAIDLMQEKLKDVDFDVVVGPESRGFIFGVPIAYNLHKPFIPIRKKGKLPCETVSVEYELEYGTATIEMHKETSMIFLQSIRMTESVEECGRLVHMLCSLKAMVWIYTR